MPNFNFAASQLGFAPMQARYTQSGPRSNTNQTGTSRIRLFPLNSVHDLVFVFENKYYVGAGAGAKWYANTNAVTITAASVELNGVTYPIFFGGSRTKVVAGGALVESDPFSLDLIFKEIGRTPNDTAAAYLRVAWDAGSSGYIPCFFADSNYAQDDWMFAGNNFVDGGTISAAGVYSIGNVQGYQSFNTTNRSAYTASLVLAKRDDGVTKSVLLIGDSIMGGAGAGRGSCPQWDGANGPFGEVACRTAKIGCHNIAMSGESTDNFMSDYHLRLGVAKYFTHAICNYGANQMSNTLAQYKTNILSVWNELKKRGLKVFQTTITPKSTVTPSTTSGGSAVSLCAPGCTQVCNFSGDGEYNRQQINTWLRDTGVNGAMAQYGLSVGGPLAGVFDAAAQVENITGDASGYPVVTSGTATAATSTTLTDSNMTNAPADHAIDGNAIIVITGGTGSGQQRIISSYANKVVTVSSAWSVTPNTTSTYTIYKASVWKLITTPITSGTATGGTASQLQDTANATLHSGYWNANINYPDYPTQTVNPYGLGGTSFIMAITAGTSAGDLRFVGNTYGGTGYDYFYMGGDSPNFTATPDATSQYAVYKSPVQDGLHPTNFGHQLMAAGIDTSKLI